jgi:hypothetical protein
MKLIKKLLIVAAVLFACQQTFATAYALHTGRLVSVPGAFIALLVWVRLAYFVAVVMRPRRASRVAADARRS